MRKRAQEEMVGFALIIIIVVVILLVFLWFALSQHTDEPLKSYEVDSFMKSALQYTTSCEDTYTFAILKDVIFMCAAETACRSGEDSCAVLATTFEDMMAISWPVSEQSPISGYQLALGVSGEELLSLEEGNLSGNSRGSYDEIVGGRRKKADIIITIYEKDV